MMTNQISIIIALRDACSRGSQSQPCAGAPLTSPMCPVAGSLPGEVEMAARGVDGVSDVVVELVWEPTWGPEVMSEAARLELGIF